MFSQGYNQEKHLQPFYHGNNFHIHNQTNYYNVENRSRKPSPPFSNSKKKKKHDLSWLNEVTVLPYLSKSQSTAAKMLGCSVSTLKRRFYELKLPGRWPIHGRKKNKAKKMKRNPNEFCLFGNVNVMNQSKCDEKFISEDTWRMIRMSSST